MKVNVKDKMPIYFSSKDFKELQEQKLTPWNTGNIFILLGLLYVIGFLSLWRNSLKLVKERYVHNYNPKLKEDELNDTA